MTVLEAMRRIAALSECRGDDDAIAELARALGISMDEIAWDIATQSYVSESPISTTGEVR